MICVRPLLMCVAWLMFVVSFALPAVQEVRLVEDPDRDVTFRARTADNLDINELTAGANEEPLPTRANASQTPAADTAPSTQFGIQAFINTALSLMNPAGWVPLIKNPANLLLFVTAICSVAMLFGPLLDRAVQGLMRPMLAVGYLASGLVALGIVWPNLLGGASVGFFLWAGSFLVMGVAGFVPEHWGRRFSLGGEPEEEVKVGLRYSKSSVNRRRDRDLARHGQTASSRSNKRSGKSSGDYYPTRKS